MNYITQNTQNNTSCRAPIRMVMRLFC